MASLWEAHTMRPGQYNVGGAQRAATPAQPAFGRPAGQPNAGAQAAKPNFATGRDGKRRIETANVAALRDLKTGLRNNAKFGKMVIYSVECVGKMAVDQTTVEEICESGCIEASLDACLLSKSNENLQTQVNNAILRASKINKSCTVSMSQTINGNFASFKNAVENLSNNDTLTSTSDVLLMLATAPEPEGELNRQRMKEQGLYTSIANRIASGTIDDPKVLAALTQVLATGASDPNVAQMAIDKGVFQELMAQMELHPNCVELARAFAELTAQASKAGDHIVQQLKALGVDKVLSKLLTKFPHDKALLDSIASAMIGLSNANEVEPLVQVLAKTNRVGSDGLISERDLEDKLDATAQLNALTMVKTNLSHFKGGENIDTIIKSHQALVQDLAKYNSEENQSKAEPEPVPITLLNALTQTSALLANIATNGGDAQRDAIMKNGGIESDIQALAELRRAHDLAKENGDYKEQQRCLDAIAATTASITALMTKKENVRALDRAGAIHAVMKATDGLPMQPQVQESLLDLILKSLQHIDVLSKESLDEMLENLCQLIRTGKVPQDGEIAKKIAQAMVLLATDEAKEKKIVAAGGVEYILKMLEMHKDNEELVKQGLAALELALMTEDGMQRFIKAGGEEQLRKLKQLHKDNVDIPPTIDNLLAQAKGYRDGKFKPMWIKGKMADQLKGQQRTKEEEEHAALVEKILTAMKNFDNLNDQQLKALLNDLLALIATGKPPANAAYAQQIALAMCMLATDEDIERAIVEAGGVEFLMAMINQHRENKDVVKQALEALELALMTPEGMEQFIKLNGQAWLKQLRETWANDPEMCGIIDNLLGMVDEYLAAIDAQEDPAIRAARLALVRAIITAMNNFDNLTEHELLQMLDNTKKLVTMGKSPDTAQDARLVALAMCMQATDEDIESQLVRSGAVEFLMDIINRYREDPDVVKQALEALELALMTNEGMDKFLELGGEEWLRNLRELWAHDADICAIIDNLLNMCHEYIHGKHVNHKLLAETPAERARRHQLIQSVLSYLAGFDNLTDEQMSLMLTDLLALISTGISPERAGDAQRVALAMCMIAVDEDIERAIVEAGAIDFLMDMVNTHKDDKEVVRQALEALELALMTNEGMDRFIELGGQDWLLQLREYYHDDEDLCQLIDNLTNMCREFVHGQEILAAQGGAIQQNGLTTNANQNGQNGQLNDQFSMFGALLNGAAGGAGGQQQRQGMNNLDMEDVNGQNRRQGMNNLSIEDQNLAQGLDLLSQLRAFGLGGGMTADAFSAPLGHMSQNQLGDGQDGFNNGNGVDQYGQTTLMTTTTQLMEQPPEQDFAGQHLVNTINQVQLYITERRAAKLLALFETLFMQEQSYDRDYLLNAVLDGLAAICEEGFECEQEIARQGGMIPFDLQPYVNPLGYSNVLNELEQGLVENRVGQRLCERILSTPETEELDIAVLSDNFATILSLITRDCITLIHVRSGLKPQIEPNVETDELPYQSSNPHLSVNARRYAINNAYEALEDAYQDLMAQRENEKQQLALQRQLEVERMKKLTQTTLSAESQMVLDRIERAKAEAALKAEKMRQEMHERLEKARREQEEKIRKMNEDAEARRQAQIDDILRAAQTATMAKIDLERRLADGDNGPKARTREDILRRLDEKVKNFLISGSLVTKHNELTGPSPRHLYITPNLEYIIYRHAGSQEVKKSQMMKLTRFLGIKQGPLCKDLKNIRRKETKKREKEDQEAAERDASGVPEFEVDDDFDCVDMSLWDRKQTMDMRKATMMNNNNSSGSGNRKATMMMNRKGSMAMNGIEDDDNDDIPTAYSDSPFFVLIGIDYNGKEREIGFECDTPEMCRRVVRAYTRLYEYSSTLNEFHSEDTMQMHSNPLYNITQAEKGLAKFVENEREKSERIAAWKQVNGIVGDVGRGKKEQTFEDLLGDDDPWKDEQH